MTVTTLNSQFTVLPLTSENSFLRLVPQSPYDVQKVFFRCSFGSVGQRDSRHDLADFLPGDSFNRFAIDGYLADIRSLGWHTIKRQMGSSLENAFFRPFPNISSWVAFLECALFVRGAAVNADEEEAAIIASITVALGVESIVATEN
ncbi:hypothetical protein ACHAW5_005099 [Stephanodiscus triporus]|uniref:Uncharacterized protein n=1 Tax=Stephanodiscus triporus TaxID=2934178 RepID=A0ABD3Q320_9STRA